MKGGILKAVKEKYSERVVSMEAIRSINHQEMANTLDDAMQVLFLKLDDAIDDVENGRVISEEELWKELDAI